MALTCDPASLPQASYWPDIAEEIDGVPEMDDADEQTAICIVLRSIARFRRVQELVSHVAEHPRMDIAAEAILLASHLNGERFGAVAVRLGVTDADVSKAVNHYIDMFRLPRPPSAKTQQAREVYSRVQKSGHFRDKTGLDFVLSKR